MSAWTIIGAGSSAASFGRAEPRGLHGGDDGRSAAYQRRLGRWVRPLKGYGVDSVQRQITRMILRRLPKHPLITVVIPTIAGREHWLDRALRSIEATTPRYETLIYADRPTCGVAWNEGIEEATGRYILLFADDLEAHEGWWQAGVRSLRRGFIPCPRILNTDGTLQSCGKSADEAEDGTSSDVARVPFLTRRIAWAIHPVFEKHYMGDYWISWRAAKLGWPTLVVREMLFTHHSAMEGRLDSLANDKEAYGRATR